MLPHRRGRGRRAEECRVRLGTAGAGPGQAADFVSEELEGFGRFGVEGVEGL